MTSEPNDAELLEVSVEAGDDAGAVVALRGELDLSTIPRAEGPLLEQIRSQNAVILDLTELSFIDSSGIAMVIGAFRAATNEKLMHTVVAPGSQVARVLRLAGVDRILPVFTDKQEALAALTDEGSA